MVMENWHLLSDPVLFVTASEENVDGVRTKKIDSARNELTGEQARKIYEEILSEDPSTEKQSSSCMHKNNKKKHGPKKIECKHDITEIKFETVNLCVKDFFKAAQNGDFDMVEKFLQLHPTDINSTDGFSWTALMMSSYAGHMDLVILLLVNGAKWIDMIDLSGYDAKDLACVGGHPELAEVFENANKYIKKWKYEKCKQKISKHIKREKVWCDKCKTYFFAPPQLGPDSHSTSTLHLFSTKDEMSEPSSHYYLSNANKGFQLMQKEGWDGQSGLGPSGVGNKFPVKTILKRNRLGFGAEAKKSKPRVTHFGAHDKSAVKWRNNSQKEHSIISEHREVSSRTKKKKLASKKCVKEKQKEIDYRREFY